MRLLKIFIFGENNVLGAENFKSFVPYHIMQDYFVDVGTDNMHPGPESNKNIANIIISFLEMQYK